jgi:serine phosphatase RsbU (regulator of sigma subunit)
MNDKQEIYGFDRLLDVDSGGRRNAADALRNKILYKVNEFSQGVVQHDDLTIIVLNAAVWAVTSYPPFGR